MKSNVDLAREEAERRFDKTWPRILARVLAEQGYIPEAIIEDIKESSRGAFVTGFMEGVLYISAGNN